MNNIIIKIKHLIDSFHYLKTSIARNSYPLKLVGERLNPFVDLPIVTFKILGKQINYDIPLSTLLENKKLLEGFSPLDCLNLGELAAKDILLRLPKEKIATTFIEYKNFMFSSNRIIRKKLSKIINNDANNSIVTSIYEYIVEVVKCNTYPCKLIGQKTKSENPETVILYNIFRKKEGFDKKLSDIIKNKELVLKFHPFEAIKFGFISTGDKYFINN